MTTFEIIQSATSILTTLGVGIAAYQLFLTKRGAQSDFEDSFSEQYRSIVADLPLKALLGQSLTDQEIEASLRTFYNYFDLCNEQAFLAARGRLDSKTWANWREGIEQQMRRPAFVEAWRRLRPQLDGSFDDFRALLPISERSFKN
ncbi:MAG TPA: hypothetical protein VJV03_16760 [Pyrinomonadaceae bacterium]|nr:hypothetical protein [Pyrinomonadaceae bacterium]